jgi:chromosome segregation ATPase
LHAGREKEPENEKISQGMSDILAKIEKMRASWIGEKENMKEWKSRLSLIDDEVTTEKAELVATAGLLDQNDKLRSQIQAEERDRARKQIEEEMLKAKQELQAEAGSELQEKSGRILELETTLEKNNVQMGDLKLEISERDKTIANLEKYSNSLEEKLTDAEVLLEAAEKDNAVMAQENAANGAKGEMQSEIDELHGKLALFEDTKYNMFESLMNQFQEDRRNLVGRHKATQGLLATAMKDVLHLAEENTRLKELLQDSITFEGKR